MDYSDNEKLMVSQQNTLLISVLDVLITITGISGIIYRLFWNPIIPSLIFLFRSFLN